MITRHYGDEPCPSGALHPIRQLRGRPLLACGPRYLAVCLGAAVLMAMCGPAWASQGCSYLHRKSLTNDRTLENSQIIRLVAKVCGLI